MYGEEMFKRAAEAVDSLQGLAAAAIDSSGRARLEMPSLTEEPPMNRRHHLGLVAIICALVALAAAPLRAQPVPSTVHIVFPFAPGGSGDALSRLIADQMSKALGTTVIVENRSGGAGRIGVRDVARSAPDGATLLLTPIAPMSVYQHVYKNRSITTRSKTSRRCHSSAPSISALRSGRRWRRRT